MDDAPKRRGETRHTSLRLPDPERELLTRLSAHLGLRKTAVVVLALRQLALREGVSLPKQHAAA